MQVQWQKQWTIPSVVGVVSFGVGIGVGYAISIYRNKTLKGMEKQMDDIESEVVQLQFKLDDRIENVNEALKHAWDIITASENQGNEPVRNRSQEVADEINKSLANHPSTVGLHEESTSVFSQHDDANDNWDWSEEVKRRPTGSTYIIHRDEYLNKEMDDEGYSQTTLTYYQGDNVLVDTDDTPIYDAERIVGTLEFGKGSGDPLVVYVRNERLEAEYEVLLDHGFYQVEVLGQEFESRFDSNKPIIHRLRPE